LQELDASFPGFLPPHKICILGAGHFGYLAAQRLSARYPHASFLVVDQSKEKLDQIEKAWGLPVQEEDIPSFLENTWVGDSTWIVPAVPIHFAFQWVMHELEKAGRVEPLPVPETVDAQIPNPYRALNGSLCASFATFICPDYCSEPDEICTYTKSPRRGNLFEVLGGITLPGFDVIVIRSWQLAPGVGGYPKSSLNKVLQEIKDQPEGRYLMVTSCRCHGVIDGLRWEGAPSR
jgi:hypothetical protein